MNPCYGPWGAVHYGGNCAAVLAFLRKVRPVLDVGLQSQYDLETAEDRLAEKLNAVVAFRATPGRTD